MSEWYLIQLERSEGDLLGASWACAIDATGRLVSAPAPVVSTALREAATGKRLAVLMPSDAVSSFSTNLPPGNEGKLLPLAAFALEDQVADDIDDLHFALGERSGVQGQTRVLVTRKAELQAALQWAEQQGLAPDAIYASLDLLPRPADGQVIALLDGAEVYMRDADGRRVGVAATEVLAGLQSLSEAQDLSATHLLVYADAQQWPASADAFEALKPQLASFKVQLSNNGLLPVLTTGWSQTSRINLLQGSLRRQESAGAQWLRWRWAAAAAATLLLLYGGGQLWNLRKLGQQEQQLDAALASTAAGVLPGQSFGPDIKAQLERRLSQMADGGGQQGEWMSLLAALAAARENVPVTTIESLSFKRGSLDLKVSGPDAASLEQLSQALRASGYRAQVAAGTAQGNQFRGQIEVRGGGV